MKRELELRLFRDTFGEGTRDQVPSAFLPVCEATLCQIDLQLRVGTDPGSAFKSVSTVAFQELFVTHHILELFGSHFVSADPPLHKLVGDYAEGVHKLRLKLEYAVGEEEVVECLRRVRRVEPEYSVAFVAVDCQDNQRCGQLDFFPRSSVSAELFDDIFEVCEQILAPGSNYYAVG